MEKILSVEGLSVNFPGQNGPINVVDDISFDIHKGETFGLVGESGSGKTITALSVLGLISAPGIITGGKILFDGKDLLKSGSEYLRSLRGRKIATVFQDPSSALDPVFTVGYQIVECIMAHERLSKTKAKDMAMDFLKKVRVGDPERVYRDYPHQLSGGTKQRAMIAMALVNSPELLILDEPTTALDVTVQSEVLDLLEGIIIRNKMSVLFISHDFGVIARMCARIGVMCQGRIVEAGSKYAVLNDPKDPYTISLIESVRALS